MLIDDFYSYSSKQIKHALNTIHVKFKEYTKETTYKKKIKSALN